MYVNMTFLSIYLSLFFILSLSPFAAYDTSLIFSPHYDNNVDILKGA